MLHIILGILKIIGILLGIIFLLLLAGLLAVIFVPVRYRLEAQAQTGERQYAFSLRVSWLLHIVSAAVTADSLQGSGITVRLFGIRLPLFGSKDGRETGEKEKKSKKEKEKKKENKKKNKKDRTAEKEKTDQKTDQKADKIAARKAEQRIEQKAEQITDRIRDKKTEKNQEEQNPGIQADAGPDDSERETETSRQGILEKIRFQCSRFCDKIRQITQNIRELWQRLVSLKQRAAALGQKVIGLLRKPGELLEFLEEYEAREVFGTLTGQLVFLLAHYKPRRIRGYLRFGTGDPATTGQLTGLIYILLPARAYSYSVEPKFNETVFETETVCSGHIRALHVLRVLWRGFRDRKLRRIITALRRSKQ